MSSEQGWSYGGTASAYYPLGDANGPDDGFPGSIFATGHEWEQQIAEISITVPVISKNIEDLNTATTLQEFCNIKGDMFGYLELPRVGLEYLKKQGEQDSDKLYFCWGQHLQEEDSGPSHGWCNLNLSEPEVKGPWLIEGRDKYLTTDYIFAIDEAWTDKYTPGYLLVTGRYRDGGQSAQGPSLFAYGPWNEGNPPEPGSSISNTVLLIYSSVYDDPEASNALKEYSHADLWSGGAWLTVNGKSAVILAGIKGIGNCWYGYGDGTVWLEDPPYPEEGPGERGWWTESYEAQIIFYNPYDLAKVAMGQIKPYEPQPYAVLSIEDFLFRTDFGYEHRILGDICYDRENGLIYLFEFRADTNIEKPIVHVWKIK